MRLSFSSTGSEREKRISSLPSLSNSVIENLVLFFSLLCILLLTSESFCDIVVLKIAVLLVVSDVSVRALAFAAVTRLSFFILEYIVCTPKSCFF